MPKKKILPKIKCLFCDEEFTPKRPWQKFCCDDCRHQQWEEDNPRIRKINQD